MNSTQNTPTPLMEAQAEEWLVKLDGAPDDTALRAQFERWYNLHPAHAEAYANAELLWLLAKQLDMPSQAPLLPEEQPGKTKPERYWYATAAAVLLAAGLGWAQFAPFPAAEFASHEQRASFALEDGSTLYLNRDTQLDTKFNSSERLLILQQGEAEFDVAHDGRPFTVVSGETRVRALGTVFSVGEHGQKQWVSVTESKVEVCLRSNCVRVKEGQHLEIRNGKFSPVQTISINNLSSWKRGLIIAENRTVQDLLEELGRYYPGEIVLLTEEVRQRRLNTVLNIDQPEQALKALAGSLGLKLRTAGPLALLHR